MKRSIGWGSIRIKGRKKDTEVPAARFLVPGQCLGQGTGDHTQRVKERRTSTSGWAVGPGLQALGTGLGLLMPCSCGCTNSPRNGLGTINLEVHLVCPILVLI